MWLRRAGLAGAVVVALASAFAPAFPLDADRPLLHAIRDSWTRREGLPSLGVTSIVQDPAGYLWIGTEAGLVRFDGVRFVVYDASTTPVLRSATVSSLLQESDGALLIATWNGLYRLRGGHWEEIGAGGESVRYRRLRRTPDGRVLAMHSGGIFVVEGTTLSPLPLRDPAGSREIVIGDVVADGDGTLWLVADNGKRLLRFDGRQLVEDALTADGPAILATIAADPAGVIWLVAEPGGLMRREGRGFVPVPAAPQLPAAGALLILFDGTGSTWISYDDGTLARLRHGAADIIPGTRGEFGGGAVDAITIDVEGNVWLGGVGLHRLRDAPVVTLSKREGWPDGWIASVYSDTRGRVWVGSQSGGLWRGDGGAWTRVAAGGAFEGSVVLAIAEDHTGTIWIGTPRRGLYWLDEASRPHLAAAERSGDIVFSLAPCQAGRCVIAGTSSGVYRVDPDGAKRMPFVVEGELNDAALAVMVDSTGRIWAGTAGSGVLVREGDRWSPAGAEATDGKTILSLLEDGDGAVWAGSVDGGLIRFRAEGGAVSITRRQGLPSDTIYAALRGAGDDLWLSTPDGIARTTRAEMIAVAEGRLERAHVDLFGFADGLRAGEGTGGGQVAGRATDGRLYFATPAGVAAVDPERAISNSRPPPVIVEEMRCDDVIVGLAGEPPRLAQGTESCNIRYTALSLRSPERTRFRYRLEGLDTGWTEAGTERLARFKHLPPRDYTFHVIAANESGVWSEEGATLRFSITPSFWQTRWFWAVGGALMAGLLFGGYRLRVGALVRRQTELERAVAVRTSELAEMNSTLERRVHEGVERLRGVERMAAYGEMVAGVAHEVRHPIFSIRSAAYLIAHKLGGEREEIAPPLATLDRETGRMARLMDDLLLFARPPALMRSSTQVRPLLEEAVSTVRSAGGWEAIDIDVEAPPGLPVLFIDRGRILQVLVNLLENARKHASGMTRVRLTAKPEMRGGVVIEVANDGQGIEAEMLPRIFDPFFTRGGGTGLGLSIVQRIVREHGGAIEADSAPDRGTRFSIALPMG